MENMFARCGVNDCIQSDCNRLEVNGCKGSIHSFECVCGQWNYWLWYEGKSKKNVDVLEDKDEENEQDCELENNSSESVDTEVYDVVQ